MKNYKKGFLFIKKMMKPHRKWFMLATLFTTLIMILNIINVQVLAALIDFTKIGNAASASRCIVYLVIIVVVIIITTYYKGITSTRLSSKTSRDIKQLIFSKLLHGNYQEVQQFRAGDLLATVDEDASRVCDFINNNMLNLISQFGMAIIGIIYLFSINSLLGLATMSFTPFGMFIAFKINRKLGSMYPINNDLKADSLSVVEQILSNIPLVKSYIVERQVIKRVVASYQEVLKNDMKISVWSGLLQPACYLTSSIPRMVFLGVGGYMVINKIITLGMYIALYNLLDIIIGPTVYFPFMIDGLNQSIAAINRINRVTLIEDDNLKITIKGSSNYPSIDISNVKFSYNPNWEVINNLCFKHNGPGIIALKGESGAGKSTVIDMIAGLLSPNQGHIKLNGKVAVLPQTPFIFTESLLENVRLCDTDISINKVKEALVFSQSNVFVNRMENGLETLIGDGKRELSGGEAQRIGLARLYASSCNVWIMDEPTTGIDDVNEQLIISRLKNFSKEKLIIMAVHKKALLDIADEVIQIDKVV